MLFDEHRVAAEVDSLRHEYADALHAQVDSQAVQLARRSARPQLGLAKHRSWRLGERLARVIPRTRGRERTALSPPVHG